MINIYTLKKGKKKVCDSLFNAKVLKSAPETKNHISCLKLIIIISCIKKN